MFFGVLLWASLGLLLGCLVSAAVGESARHGALTEALSAGGSAIGGYLARQGLAPDLLHAGGLLAAMMGALSLLAAYHLVQRVCSR